MMIVVTIIIIVIIIITTIEHNPHSPRHVSIFKYKIACAHHRRVVRGPTQYLYIYIILYMYYVIIRLPPTLACRLNLDAAADRPRSDDARRTAPDPVIRLDTRTRRNNNIVIVIITSRAITIRLERRAFRTHDV